jgi:hypothetical protein
LISFSRSTSASSSSSIGGGIVVEDGSLFYEGKNVVVYVAHFPIKLLLLKVIFKRSIIFSKLAIAF